MTPGSLSCCIGVAYDEHLGVSPLPIPAIASGSWMLTARVSRIQNAERKGKAQVASSTRSIHSAIHPSTRQRTTAHVMDHEPERQDDAKEPLFPPSPPRGVSRLSMQDDGQARDIERLCRDPGQRRLDQVRRPSLFLIERLRSDAGESNPCR